MNRIIGCGYREIIGIAIAGLPPRIRDRVAFVDFLCGVDPVFVGLHNHAALGDGRPSAQTAHCTYSYLQMGDADRRRTTVCLPVIDDAVVSVVWHELGHALHEAIGFRFNAQPITEYAKTNRFEAFAEAFTAWRSPWYAGRDLRDIDPQADAFFERLAA